MGRLEEVAAFRFHLTLRASCAGEARIDFGRFPPRPELEDVRSLDLGRGPDRMRTTHLLPPMLEVRALTTERASVTLRRTWESQLTARAKPVAIPFASISWSGT